MDFIDDSGDIFLVREPAPDVSRWREFGYDATMAFANLNKGNPIPMVSAVYQGRVIPLYYGSNAWRLTELHSGHGFQIREAEFLNESNEIITFSTANRDGSGWGKLNGELSKPIKEYFIIKYSAETGLATGYWDFFERSWTADFPEAIGAYFPEGGNWNNIPSNVPIGKSAYVSMWSNAVADFPEFFDIQKGLRRGVSTAVLDSNGETSAPDNQRLTYPDRFQVDFVDEITNFNPNADKLFIDQGEYGITGSMSLKVVKGKNSKAVSRAIKKFARTEFDFIYNYSTGFLYFNENGRHKGFGDGGVCAFFSDSPLLNAENFELI